MTEETDHEADDLLGDIYDESAPEHSVVSSHTPKPWHHPRKHWVRINQLCFLAQKLIAETHFTDETLRYLTLPSEELIDIQVLEGSEELLDVQSLEGALDSPGKAKYLKYLGFNKIGNDTERLATQNHAESVLADKSSILAGSKILNDKVEDIADTSTLAYRTVKDVGPFNIINLDLCASVANKSPDHKGPTYFDAITRILELQRENMAQPFLLCIATRTGIKNINASSLAIIANVHSDNISESEEFKSKFEQLLHCEAYSLLDGLTKGEEVSQESLNTIFGVGIGKWLLHMMKNSAPFWDVSLEHLCCYSVHDGKPDMLTIAFKFKKVNEGMFDKIGLTKILGFQEKNKPEPELAISMLEKAKEIVDVDALLLDNVAERAKIIAKFAKLLTNIGYTEGDYITWANSLYDSGQARAVS